MKKTFIIASLLNIFILLNSCYEDKGNYDYKNINRITIKKLKAEDGWGATFGSTLNIIPELVFENGNNDESHLKYKWAIENVPHREWNERNFNWVADTVLGSKYLALTITDTRTGILYTSTFDLRVGQEFGTLSEVTILSEKDGNSQLSVIKFDLSSKNKRTTIKSANIYENVYEERQKEVLGQGPVSIYEHFTRTKNSSPKNSQYLILQKSGAVDVIGSTITKDVDFKNTFIGGAYPPLVQEISSAAFMKYTDVVTDQNGRLYSRIRMVPELYHTSYFFNDPLKFEDKVLNNCTLLPAPYAGIKLTLIHDKSEKRFLAIFDGVSSGDGMSPEQENAGKITHIPAKPLNSNDTPEGFISLNNFGEYEFVTGGYYRTDDGTYSVGYFMIFNNSAGEYFRQSFVIEKDWTGLNLEVRNAQFGKINIPGTPSIVYPTQYSGSGSSDVFFAIDNKLYRFDRLSPDKGLVEHLVFDAKIISISTECYYNHWGIVALDNGKIVIIDVPDAKNLSEEEKIIYQLPEDVNFGEIAQAIVTSRGNAW